MTVDDILQAFSRQGTVEYYGEPVSLAEHSLQAAHFAALAGAPDTLILAALLHDIGHLLGSAPSELSEWKTDARHELVGCRLLESTFPLAVTEPIRLHVAAKRYLCAADSSYLRQLSAASVQTLTLQQGPMPPAEMRSFEAETFHAEAVLLRRCDDQGKVQGMPTPDLSHYAPLLRRVARPGT